MEIPRIWRIKDQRMRLQGEICGSCNEKIFPPRPVCPNCKGERIIAFQFSGKGDVYEAISSPMEASRFSR